MNKSKEIFKTGLKLEWQEKGSGKDKFPVAR